MQGSGAAETTFSPAPETRYILLPTSGVQGPPPGKAPVRTRLASLQPVRFIPAQS